MKSSSPIVKHLVLVGGGHSHLAVLKHFGMKPVPGLALTLISRDISTPYSGSLPGFLSGLYDHDEIHIDLRPLAQFAGARIIQAEIQEIDLANKAVKMTSRPDINFDLISLNIGSSPNMASIPGAIRYGIGIKPIDRFIEEWPEILRNAIYRIRKDLPFRFVIVGGGPASVELALAAEFRISKEINLSASEKSKLQIQIISADNELLSLHNSRVRKFAVSVLEKRGIKVLLKTQIVSLSENTLICKGGSIIKADTIVCATGASIPSWPSECGLAITEDGFIEVSEKLQSTSHKYVFAAGDAATIKGEPRPKSGVYAVRQGAPLAKNLVRYATGKRLVSYKPQKHTLALISTGNKTAIASRNNFFFHGKLVWSLKNKIDKAFIRKYTKLPVMDENLDITRGLVDRETEKNLKLHAIRCAGCGAKVASNILEEVLSELPNTNKEEIISGTSAVEDASMIKIGGREILLQSVDQIKAFINDPWIFAKIATNHCLSDIYAMGCNPHSALAIVGIPFSSKDFTKSQLHELMLSCSETLKNENCTLIGGHSAESADLTFGLCVNGFIEEGKILKKNGMQKDDVLVLTKPLGTGTLLAADMRSKASHANIQNALQEMAISNRAASEIFIELGATSCTDITGFGLIGHLIEMLTTDNVEVELTLENIPALPGSLEALKQKIFSSLHTDNSAASYNILNQEDFRQNPKYQLLFDPQTSGGLLASMPYELAETCIARLHDSGYPHASVVGQAQNLHANGPSITLK